MVVRLFEFGTLTGVSVEEVVQQGQLLHPVSQGLLRPLAVGHVPGHCDYMKPFGKDHRRGWNLSKQTLTRLGRTGELTWFILAPVRRTTLRKPALPI